MNWFAYFLWFVLFVAGVCFTYFLPETTLSFSQKFLLITVWGASLGIILTALLSKKMKNSVEDAFSENLIQDDLPVAPENPGISENVEETETLQVNPYASKLKTWSRFCIVLAKARPFPEVVELLKETLVEIFSGASGALYMYNGSQMELRQIFSFGSVSVGDEQIHSEECSSFQLAEIVVNDFNDPGHIVSCTHLHRQSEGYSLCAPIEGMEEHFGTLVLYFPKEKSELLLHEQKMILTLIASTFGIFVANQNLNILFQSHSIRDTLTSLFNRRYMEEALAREVAYASRHDLSIGMIMFRPDSLQVIRESHGLRAAEQLLWEIAQRIPRYIRSEDIPCRYDANTFCVILPGASIEITLARAEKIRHEIEHLEISYGNILLSSTLSLGIANIPNHASDDHKLIQNSLSALSVAEQCGGNSVKTAERVSSSP